ncbi:MAG: hypothetical protein WAK23_13650 [Terriglobales bacterium]
MTDPSPDQLTADAAVLLQEVDFLQRKWGVKPSAEAVASERRKRNAERKLRSVVTRSPAPILGGPKAVMPMAARLPLDEWCQEQIYSPDKIVIASAVKLDSIYGRPLTMLVDHDLLRPYIESTEWYFFMQQDKVYLRNCTTYTDVFLGSAVLARNSTAAFKRCMKTITIQVPKIDESIWQVDYRLASLDMSLASDISDDWKINNVRVQNVAGNWFILDQADPRKNSARAWKSYQFGKYLDDKLWNDLFARWFRLLEHHRVDCGDDMFSFQNFRMMCDRSAAYNGIGWPQKGDRLLRIDSSKKWTEGNIRWGSQADAYSLRKAEKEKSDV